MHQKVQKTCFCYRKRTRKVLLNIFVSVDQNPQKDIQECERKFFCSKILEAQIQQI
jgi:hypothetical protein